MIPVKSEGELLTPPADAILYMEVTGKWTTIHFTREWVTEGLTDKYGKAKVIRNDIVVRKALSDFEPTVEPMGFFRISREFLVNLSKVTQVNKKEREIVLISGDRVYVSREKAKPFMRALRLFNQSARIFYCKEID